MTRVEKLQALADRPEKVFKVKEKKRLWGYIPFFSDIEYLGITLNEGDNFSPDHWFVMLTNGPNSHYRGLGAEPAYAADFLCNNGERYHRHGLSGAWKSAISLWPAESDEEVRKIFSHVSRQIDLAYEQYVLEA